LQQIPDVALFFFDVRNLASSIFEGDYNMKRFLTAIALACVLSVSALAGDVPSDGFASPPPHGMAQTTSVALPGDIPSGDSAQPAPGAVLSFIQAVIGLLAI
jgi:hypothetical protein